MREQARLLENVTDRTFMRLKRFSCRIVLPHGATHAQKTRQAVEPCYTTQDGRLAGARRAEQGSYSPHRHLEGHVESETAQGAGKPGADRGVRRLHVPGRAMRFSSIIIENITANENASMPA